MFTGSKISRRIERAYRKAQRQRRAMTMEPVLSKVDQEKKLANELPHAIKDGILTVTLGGVTGWVEFYKIVGESGLYVKLKKGRSRPGDIEAVDLTNRETTRPKDPKLMIEKISLVKLNKDLPHDERLIAAYLGFQDD
jgi:hypothetical protein